MIVIKATLNNTTTSSTGHSSKLNNNEDNTIKSDTVCTNSSGTGSTTNSCVNSSTSSNNSTSSKSTSSDNCNLIDNSVTSSGITSGNSCISDESDESSIHLTNSKNENAFPVNTIKYNAKTNIFQQTSFPNKVFGKKTEPITEQQLKSKNFIKLGPNNKAFQQKLMLGTLLECQTQNYTASSQNSSAASTKEDNEYSDEFCFNQNLNEELSGISLDVDNSKEKTNFRLQNKIINNNKCLIINNFNNDNMTNSYVNNLDYYQWLNENNSSSASITPVESSAYSTTSISPPLILKALPLSQSITQATASSSSSAALSTSQQSSSTLNKKLNYENLLSSYQYTSPFPLNSQYQNDSASEAQKQMFQLNSSSSLTLVSKAPSMSYCYINDNNSSSNDIFAKVGTEPFNLETARTSVLTGTISSAASSSSSSSSGCSSLENNQFYGKDKNLQFPNRFNDPNAEAIKENERNNSSFILQSQRPISDTLNRPFPNGQKKYQHFSTYKPLLKTTTNNNSEIYANGQPIISGQIKLNNSNNPINKYPFNATKGDFV